MKIVSNNNTHKATIALLPSTTHPQSWAEPHVHIHTGKSLPSVPPLPEEHNLPFICPSTTASCRSSAKDWSWLGHESSPYSFCLRNSQTPTTNSRWVNRQSYIPLPNTYAVFSILLSLSKFAYMFPKSFWSFSTKMPLIYKRNTPTTHKVYSHTQHHTTHTPICLLYLYACLALHSSQVFLT